MKCGKQATLSIIWNSKTLYMCEDCARTVQAMIDHMGWPLHFHVYIGPEKCGQELGEKEDDGD